MEAITEVNAKKGTYSEIEAFELLKGVNEIYATKGKKVVHLTLGLVTRHKLPIVGSSTSRFDVYSNASKNRSPVARLSAPMCRAISTRS